MKKLIRQATVLVILLVMSVSLVSVGASNYGAQADSLNDLGLFRGTNKGYELDRAPTRAEAAVMIVRLLGKEQEVLAGSYSHPFKDVPQWVNNYVGYLYENGLTKGTSPTTFSSSARCSSQMYTVFVLRALGYTEENNSITYSDAVQFAKDLGLTVDDSSAPNSFTRDDLVAISYSALFQAPKSDNSTTLLNELVSANAVSSDKADKYTTLYDTYKEYEAAISAAAINTSAEVQQNVNMDISVLGTSTKVSQVSHITAVKDGDIIIAKSDDESTVMGVTSQSTSYYSDGWLYTDSENGKYKTKIDMGDISQVIGLSTETEPFYQINSISKSVNEDGTTYTVEYSADAMSSYLNSVLGSSGNGDLLGGGSMKINSAKMVTVIGADGKLKSQSFEVDVTATAMSEGQAIEMSMIINTLTSVVKTDNTISITLPSDLNHYQDISNLG